MGFQKVKFFLALIKTKPPQPARALHWRVFYCLKFAQEDFPYEIPLTTFSDQVNNKVGANSFA